ncbi:MAG: cobalamin biosynthesis protein CobD [Desulfobacteraceae bacterium]|nr:MAG: cobalamin biosynthesis protein CobD [Desulfobacteraceae bacterium]
MSLIVCIWIALALDYFIGDPRWLPHPVRLIGVLALRLEAPMRKRFASARTAGLLTALAVIGITALAAWICLVLAARLAPWLGYVATVIMLYTSFAARDLDHHGRSVLAALLQGDLPLARQRVAWIVGRDTARLDEHGVARAAVESVAENTVDGVIAPLFFAFLGGPVAAMTYKAISTLDSTFGYRSERYIQFGWASARIDDAANYLPARVGALLIAIGAWLLKEDPRGSLMAAWRDGSKHSSPNAGLAEASMAGALGIQLGGPVFRNGRLDEMPAFGDPRHALAAEHIARACRLMMASTLAAAGVFSLVRTVLGIM